MFVCVYVCSGEEKAGGGGLGRWGLRSEKRVWDDCITTRGTTHESDLISQRRFYGSPPDIATYLSQLTRDHILRVCFLCGEFDAGMCSDRVA
jgi:hypothetical protein